MEKNGDFLEINGENKDDFNGNEVNFEMGMKRRRARLLEGARKSQKCAESWGSKSDAFG